MWHWRPAVAVAAAVALALTGCSREIEGVAQPDPRQAGVALTSDGFGIVAGFADAPLQLEIFTEPQCPHCAHLQATFGEEIKAHMQSGELAVTYRPMTFLDYEYEIDYSAIVDNALFLAVEPSTSAEVFQTFVEDLWANQDLSFIDYADKDFADLARDSGLSDEIVTRIADGDSAVDTDEMGLGNEDLLSEQSPESPGTPVVYNLKEKDTVDISDADWLDKLLRTT
ncbi:thioredoxin domain-containing protein [soil metagenome]